ncbi:MAG: hypothetical protein KZQ67_17130 [gamma proteobacterium symbiont of Bathyaustriella thionipta]|nr:hypothetical protein [gamma proteobacterium symbiont of Bathyaustriella thionipta]MCU7951702.1 hypothetical protein [gamma proteobacterium symbiont of Bathyaustriella thionipta]MCU7958303.1 hypothetical protein [gamma proteobacterium symbiont of Bathyaustriella thionipta]
MTIKLANDETLHQICHEASRLIDKPQRLDTIITALNSLMPELNFTKVLTRGHWYRLGGIVDKNYQPVSDNIALWAEYECDGDVDEIILKHMDSGYFATRLAGKTHYFTAQYGTKNEEFVQLEIEELQEVIDRPLIDRDWFPDCLEDFIDPLDFPKLEPEPTGKHWYEFRRMSDIAELMHSVLLQNRTLSNLKRFFLEWDQSSAFDEHPFCQFWILALREYQDSDREQRLRAKPVSTYAERLPGLPPGKSLHGTELSKAIHDYDHQLGYPFAWYFTMLSSKSSNYELAQSVLRDQMGAYEYLPAKDLKILRQWEERPYGI